MLRAVSGGAGGTSAGPPVITDSSGFYLDFGNAGLQGKSSLAGIVPAQFGGVGNTAITLSGLGDWAISGGYAKQNGTLAYAQFVTSAPVINELVIDFLPTATGAQFAIAYGVQPTLAVQVIHCTVTDTTCSVMARMNSSLGLGNAEDGVLGITWVAPLRTDGSTVYTMRFITRGDTLVVVGPNGEADSVADPRVGYCAGNTAFFENAGTAWIKRFYAVSAPPTSTIPAPYLSAGDLHTRIAPPAVQAYVGGGQGVQQLSTYGNNQSTLRSYLFFGPNGAYALKANILAAVVSGATSFQCDQPLPNGTYAFDLCSALGNNKELVTVSGTSGTASPFTITCAALTKNHPLPGGGIPFSLVNTGALTAAALYGISGNLDCPGLFQALTAVTVGNDGYSCVLRQGATNWMQVGPDYGPGNGTSQRITGALAVGGTLTGALAGPTNAYTIPSGSSAVTYIGLQPTAATTLTLTWPTPPAANDGFEVVLVNLNNFLATLTNAGAAVGGAPASLAQYAFARFRWFNSLALWARVG